MKPPKNKADEFDKLIWKTYVVELNTTPSKKFRIMGKSTYVMSTPAANDDIFCIVGEEVEVVFQCPLSNLLYCQITGFEDLSTTKKTKLSVVKNDQK